MKSIGTIPALLTKSEIEKYEQTAFKQYLREIGIKAINAENLSGVPANCFMPGIDSRKSELALIPLSTGSNYYVVHPNGQIEVEGYLEEDLFVISDLMVGKILHLIRQS